MTDKFGFGASEVPVSKQEILREMTKAIESIDRFFATVSETTLATAYDDKTPLGRVLCGVEPCDVPRDSIIELIQFQAPRMALEHSLILAKLIQHLEQKISMGEGAKPASLTVREFHRMIAGQMELQMHTIMVFSSGVVRGDFNQARLINSVRAIYKVLASMAPSAH